MEAITIIIRAPNHQAPDQVVNCTLSWTVKELKEYVATNYPGKPKINHQKIIYMGQLLQDESILKDVFVKYHTESFSTTHTVHLVCQFSGTDDHSSASSTTTHNAAYRNPSDELRHRFQPVAPVFPTHLDTNVSQYMPFQSVYGGLSGLAFNTTPDPTQWHEMMYLQQMAQYMQYYQQMYGYQMQNSPLPQSAEPPVAEAQPNLGQQQQQQQQQPGMRMNAQGGPVVDDDDEDGQRDWLDWTYTFCRIFVLFTIVYFYSTFSRFVLVFALFFLIYLYQTGRFALLRPNEAAEPPQPAAEAPPAPPQPRGHAPAPAEVPEQEEEREPVVEQPGLFRTVYTIVYAFFSSLVPQQPVVVNAN